MSNKPFIVVSGTSRGLGKEIANELLSQGFDVVGLSRTPSFAAGSPTGFREIISDLGDLQAIPELVRTIVTDFGIPYGLVNNAAIGIDGLLSTQSNSFIEDGIRLNLTSPILLTKYISRHMLESRQGRVINISSIVASTGYSGLSVYAATKAGLLGFTKSLSREVGRRGLTVNAIQPGFMSTDMTKGLQGDQLQKIIRRSALNELPVPVDVARLVAFLMGPGGEHVTGTSFVVDSGNTA
jgi:3-oxoacyl-[acyl-carrier protein] reductase